MTVRPADWMSVTEALEIMLAAVEPRPLEQVPLERAAGRVLGTPAHAPLDMPPWDNSGMDGYAVLAADVKGASREHPLRLRLLESVQAGGFPSRELVRGAAIKVMTGAPVPQSADSVIRVEHTVEHDDGTVEVFDAFDAGRNIRPRGEDMRAMELVLAPGALLRSAEIGVLASMGMAQVPVHVSPRVAVLATGDELVPVERFEEVRAGRRIVNSNTYALAAALQSMSCEPVPLGIATDDEASLREHISRALGADALITTAGASVGEHDLVKDVLEAMGLTLRFWRVRMRPGSPFSFGTIERADREPLPVFGLPGNPVSAVVTFEVLVRPALRRMLGRSDVFPRTIRVRAAAPIPSKTGLMHFLRVSLEQDAHGEWLARLTGAQGSGMLTSLTRADALIVVPETCAGFAEGETALALPLPGIDAASASPRFELMEEV